MFRDCFCKQKMKNRAEIWNQFQNFMDIFSEYINSLIAQSVQQR